MEDEGISEQKTIWSHLSTALIVIAMIIFLYMSLKGLSSLYNQLSGSIQADVHVTLGKTAR